MTSFSRERPRIGVTGSRRRGRLMWWFNRFALWRAGARAVRLVPGRDVPFEALDGLVIGGGDDIDATLYGMELEPTVRVDYERDALELSLLEHAAKAEKPVLGICRGAQILNIFFGGSLHVDIREAYDGIKVQRTPLPRKRITIEAGTRLARILQCESCRVNALHRQAIDRLGAGLSIVAHDADDIIQGVEADSERFLVGVQWHPEFLVFDAGQQRLYRAVAKAAKSWRQAYCT